MSNLLERVRYACQCLGEDENGNACDYTLPQVAELVGGEAHCDAVIVGDEQVEMAREGWIDPQNQNSYIGQWWPIRS